MKSPQPPKRKLLERVRDTIRLKQYSRATEKTYTSWIKSFILLHNKRHPKTMDTPEIEQYLTHLAVQKNVAASTQNPTYRRSPPSNQHLFRIFGVTPCHWTQSQQKILKKEHPTTWYKNNNYTPPSPSPQKRFTPSPLRNPNSAPDLQERASPNVTTTSMSPQLT